MDRASVLALRLHKTREAFQGRDLVSAVLEAEEILLEDAQNQQALVLLGEAELELVHGLEASLVFEELLEMEPEEPRFLTGFAVARFLCADFEGSLDASRKALELPGEFPEAYAYAGLALERLGEWREAARHLERASSLAPERFPRAVPMEEIDWDGLLERALAQLPSGPAHFYSMVPVVWQRFPDISLLKAANTFMTPFAFALYEGTPGEGGQVPLLPRSVRVFKGNICRFAQDLDKMAQDLAQALLTEAANWLGAEIDAAGHQETELETEE